MSVVLSTLSNFVMLDMPAFLFPRLLFLETRKASERKEETPLQTEKR